MKDEGLDLVQRRRTKLGVQLLVTDALLLVAEAVGLVQVVE